MLRLASASLNDHEGSKAGKTKAQGCIYMPANKAPTEMFMQKYTVSFDRKTLISKLCLFATVK